MPSSFTEDTYEQAIIELFENMGYDHLYAPNVDRDYTSPLLDSVLRDSLVRINRGLPVEAIGEALTKLRTFDTGSLLQKNITFMDYLQNGITVKFFVNGEEQSSIVRLIDFKPEYGIDSEGNIILADEITPDTSRLWDWDTNEKLDKDRFRRDMGNVEEAYHEVIRRLTGEGK